MSQQKDNNSRLVYSSEKGKVCPDCRRAMDSCSCRKKKQTLKAATDGVVRVGRETKGRKGKGVTIITGIPLAGDELKALGKQFKKKCGTGGTVKSGVIEIQGDHRDILIEELQKKGWTVKRSGG